MLRRGIVALSILLCGCNTAPQPAPVEDAAAKVRATLDAIETARQATYTRYLDCRAGAEESFNRGLEVQGTPTPGKKGIFTEKIPGSFDKLRQQQNFDETECRKVYEAELGLIQPRVQSQTEVPQP
jgi:hypothetical protein